MTEIALTIPTVRDLRHRWKPHKERLAGLKGEQATSIRFHRACSWMAHLIPTAIRKTLIFVTKTRRES